MSNGEERALMAQDESSLGRIVITEAQVNLIKNTIAHGASDDELKLFFFECRRRGVHPLDRLIHFVKRGQGDNAKVAFQCGIDFMRSQAEATGEYRGQEDVDYGPMVEIAGHKDLKAPEWAKATVKRRDSSTGEIINTSATAFWSEFYPGESMGFMWRKMPRLMLGKVAEAQALRKAFPRQLQGLYSFEEMEQADIIEAPSKPDIKPPQAKIEAQPAKQAKPKIKDPDSPVTDAQVKAIHTMIEKYGIKDDDTKHSEISSWLSLEKPITSLHDLTKGQASTVIDFLNQTLKASNANG